MGFGLVDHNFSRAKHRILVHAYMVPTLALARVFSLGGCDIYESKV